MILRACSAVMARVTRFLTGSTCFRIWIQTALIRLPLLITSQFRLALPGQSGTDPAEPGSDRAERDISTLSSLFLPVRELLQTSLAQRHLLRTQQTTAASLPTPPVRHCCGIAPGNMPQLASAADTKYQLQLPTVSFRVVKDDRSMTVPAGVHSVRRRSYELHIAAWWTGLMYLPGMAELTSRSSSGTLAVRFSLPGFMAAQADQQTMTFPTLSGQISTFDT